jgi:hypothetical protein
MEEKDLGVEYKFNRSKRTAITRPLILEWTLKGTWI